MGVFLCGWGHLDLKPRTAVEFFTHGFFGMLDRRFWIMNRKYYHRLTPTPRLATRDFGDIYIVLTLIAELYEWRIYSQQKLPTTMVRTIPALTRDKRLV